jgi:hypothetical protein
LLVGVLFGVVAPSAFSLFSKIDVGSDINYLSSEKSYT